MISKSSVGNFELNANKYNKEELEEIFELPPNYDNILIEIKSTQLRDNMFSYKGIENSVKDNINTFINQAKEILIKQLKNTTNNFQKIVNADVYNLDYNLKPAATLDVGLAHTIIEKEDRPYTQSMPSEFYPGALNPLKKRILNKSINIDTRFRNNYYATQSTNFHLDLPIKFNNVVSLQLSAFEFSTTAYVISKQSGTNFFWVSASPNDNSVIPVNPPEKLCIIVPDGNYTPIDLVNFINNYISTNASFVASQYLKNIVFVLNIGGTSLTSGSGQMVVGIKTNSNVTYSFNFNLDFQADINGNPDNGTPLPLKLGWIMGFREGYYENNTDYVSEGIVDTSGPRYLYLVVDDYNNNVNNNFYSAFNSSILNKNILARISLQSPVFNNLTQNNLNLITTPRQYFGPIDIQKLQVQLLDEYGRIITLNNMDYSFCLTMQLVYDI